MDKKVFNSPIELADWFRQNPDMLGPIPWGGNLIAHIDNLGKGCKCKTQVKVQNVEQVYKDIVINIFKENANFAKMIKGQTKAEVVVFLLNGVLLAEI
jgi:hypothetical protein